jgi:hypothetical protein
MDTITAIQYARELLSAHGDRAEAEAAQKAANFDAKGDKAQAESWRKVRKAIKELRSANVS